MAYTEKQKEEILNNIFEKIEEGISTRKAVVECGIPAKTFYQWIEADGEKSKQYARACELRAESLFDEMIEIADTTCEGIVIETDDNGRSKEKKGDMLGHRKLQVDTRKWMISKLAPKKYGDKLELEQNGTISISWNEEKTYQNKE